MRGCVFPLLLIFGIRLHRKAYCSLHIHVSLIYFTVVSQKHVYARAPLKQTTKFWNALLPVESYRIVSLKEQVEKYYCDLPSELHDYCIKTKLANMSQLIEVANTAY